MTDVLWLTGVSGAGKTTTAHAIKFEWSSVIGECVVLDADETRKFWPELGLSDEDRVKNVTRLASLAAIIGNQLREGLIIVACIAPTTAVRVKAKKIIEAKGCKFYEIYIHAPLDTRIERDSKGLYQKAIKGEILNLTGYDGVYEIPNNPLLTFDTSRQTPEEIAIKVVEEIL